MTVTKRSRRLCAICGIREATTRDHVPPRAVFHDPVPTDLITVPACVKCNNEGSKYDSELRVFVSMHVGIDSPLTHSLWKNYALRTVARNNKLRKHILDHGSQVNLKSPAGLHLGQAYAVPMSVRAHHAAIDRIVRGLYFHHFGQALGRWVSVHVNPLNSLPVGFSEEIKNWPAGWVGNKEFFYRFGRAAESPLDSVWLLLFYGKYCVFAQTKSKRRSNRRSQGDAQQAARA